MKGETIVVILINFMCLKTSMINFVFDLNHQIYLITYLLLIIYYKYISNGWYIFYLLIVVD